MAGGASHADLGGYPGSTGGAANDFLDQDVRHAHGSVGPAGDRAAGEPHTGRIGSVDDPITRYVPELLRRDRRFERITLRHLLTMRSGLRYEESGTPWSDDTATYYAPDLRAAALRKTEIVEEPGRRFHYNNYNPLLVGLALERTTGMPVATYLERKLWQPLGMEADGSWSLDSRRSGFEKMESGLNGRAIDLSKLGVLYANGGAWHVRQLVPRAWVQDPTVVPTRRGSTPAPGYQYFWWDQSDRSPAAFFARGKYGQHIYVVPKTGLVLVRFGRDSGYGRWPELLSDLARRVDESTSGKVS
jgi:CubicO group peptidase (beta-lactamase class C family)